VVDETELRTQLTSSKAPAIEIDTGSVISRARASRRGRQWAVGGAAVLAVSSFVFTGANIFPLFTNDTVSVSTLADDATDAPESEAADTSGLPFAPEESRAAEVCGTSVAEEASSPFGLTLELDFPAEVVASGSAYGSVRLTNSSNTAVTGSTASVPDVSLLRNSVVVSHSPDVQILSVIPVNLQPGQSIEFPVEITIYDCTTIDSGGMIDPGTYQLSTTLAFVPADPADGIAAEIRSARFPITLK